MEKQKYDLFVGPNVSDLHSNPFNKGKTYEGVYGLCQSNVVAEVVQRLVELEERGYETFPAQLIDAQDMWDRLKSGKIWILKLAVAMIDTYDVTMFVVVRSDE